MPPGPGKAKVRNVRSVTFHVHVCPPPGPQGTSCLRLFFGRLVSVPRYLPANLRGNMVESQDAVPIPWPAGLTVVVSTDAGCLMNIGGADAIARGSRRKLLHIARVLLDPPLTSRLFSMLPLLKRSTRTARWREAKGHNRVCHRLEELGPWASPCLALTWPWPLPSPSPLHQPNVQTAAKNHRSNIEPILRVAAPFIRGLAVILPTRS